MCSDLVYVILFPQLLMVVHFRKYCNTYGSLSAYIIACVVRFSGGEDVIGLPVLIRYPGYDWEKGVQRFPFRTMAMLLSLGTLYGVTRLSKYVNHVFMFVYDMRGMMPVVYENNSRVELTGMSRKGMGCI